MWPLLIFAALTGGSGAPAQQIKVVLEQVDGFPVISGYRQPSNVLLWRNELLAVGNAFRRFYESPSITVITPKDSPESVCPTCRQDRYIFRKSDGKLIAKGNYFSVYGKGNTILFDGVDQNLPWEEVLNGNRISLRIMTIAEPQIIRTSFVAPTRKNCGTPKQMNSPAIDDLAVDDTTITLKRQDQCGQFLVKWLWSADAHALPVIIPTARR